MSAAKLNLEISQGKTFSKVLRWGQSRKVYKAITGATKAAPCVLTVVGHSLKSGWPFKIENVLGMAELNSINRSTNDGLYIAVVNDSDHIEINDVNSLGFGVYTSGGTIVYNEPVDLTGYTARMQVRASVDATDVLLSLTSAGGGILIDATAKTITMQLSAADSAALTFTSGVYDLEMISGAGGVSSPLYGRVDVIKEVTR